LRNLKLCNFRVGVFFHTANDLVEERLIQERWNIR
jgi:hypothetical protein